MRPTSNVIPALLFFIAIFTNSIIADVSEVKRAAKLSGLDLQKSAGKQSMLLQRKLTAKIKVFKKGSANPKVGGSHLGVGQIMKRVGVDAMIKKRSDPPPILSQRQVGVTSLTGNVFDSSWKIPFQIYNSKGGTLAYDSGSSVTIINHDAYHPSSFAQPTGYVMEITYLDGTVGGGDIYNDYITIAGLTIWTTLVWADDNFVDADYGSDGIVGVGFASGLTAASFIEAMVQNFTMLNDVICMTMASHSDGNLQFGALDATIVYEIKYTHVMAKHGAAWDTTASINGVGPFDVMIDSGTTYIFLQTKVAEALFRKLGLKAFKTNDGPGQPDFLWASCKNGKEAPELSITMGSILHPFIISSKNAAAWNEKSCRLSVIGSSQLDDSQLAIFGAAFLKNVHFVMDRGLYKMGFAQRLIGPGE